MIFSCRICCFGCVQEKLTKGECEVLNKMWDWRIEEESYLKICRSAGKDILARETERQ
jgi:hypothetical protein